MVIYTSADQTERLDHLSIWGLEDKTAWVIIVKVLKDSYLQRF